VARSKLVLDFALTVHLLHLLAVWAYAGLPRTLLWWGVQASSAALTISLATWGCRQRELRPIAFGAAKVAAADAPEPAGEHEPAGEQLGEYELGDFELEVARGQAREDVHR
jgi:hypothetical protein